MMKQYNHYLFVLAFDGDEDSVQDANGNWETPNKDWEFHSVCREETNGKGSMIQGADGQALVFSSLVQLPKGTKKVPEGTKVRVCESQDPESVLRIEGQVLKFDSGQLHCRLWV